MSFTKSFAAFDKQRVIDRTEKLRADVKSSINAFSAYHINKEIEKSWFWNKWTFGLIKIKSVDDIKDIYSLLSMAESWYYSDLISKRNYYTNIQRLAVQCDSDVVYLSADDAKIFSGD